MSYYAKVDGNIQFETPINLSTKAKIIKILADWGNLDPDACSEVDLGATFIEFWHARFSYDEDKTYKALNALKELVEIKNTSALSFNGEDGNMWKITYDGISWEEFVGHVYYIKPDAPTYEDLRTMFVDYVINDREGIESPEYFREALEVVGCNATWRKYLNIQIAEEETDGEN